MSTMTGEDELSFAALQDALDTLALFHAMFPLENELSVEPASAEALPDLQQLVEMEAGDSGTSDLCAALDSLNFTLALSIEEEGVEDPCLLDIQLLLKGSTPHPPQLQIRQPAFLSRSQHHTIATDLSNYMDAESSSSGWTSSDLLLGAVDIVRESAGRVYRESQAEEVLEEAPVEALGELQRTWFWFPSLSSKEKRQDFVDYSHEFKLTGFVMAGKPGLLCVEGNFPNADRFMATIKSKSWSDIPSFQKKVTERLRNPITERAFTSMSDITDLIPKHGQYNHRGDMSEVKRLMESWGVGEDFSGIVLGL